MVKTRVVLTTGAFDILHLGHMKMFSDAKKVGGPRSKLVVLVASDRTVMRNKGRMPVFAATERKKMLEFLKPVDKVIIGYDPLSFEKVLKKVKPDIVAFGYDQKKIKKAFVKFCRERGYKVRVVTLRKHKVNPMSSSDVLRKVLRRRIGR
ncbi:MAG: adenylyltransferase/cytidyltransferase family protein [Candidatus Caldarchaeum sp.]|uniref:Nucleotidyltransferase n=1 Tax=Caldiarchaeum subterraneum TaxID=311458 RepID=A0A7C5Q7N0_CALS0